MNFRWPADGSQSLTTVLFVAAIFLFVVNPIADFDTGFHLKTGETIINIGRVPLNDSFSYSAAGMRWIAHYWLADVVFFSVYRLAGYWGLIAFVGLLAAATYSLVLATTRLMVKSRFLPLIILVPYAVLTYELWVVRPQIFSYFLAALLIYLLEKWRRGGGIKYLLCLPAIFLFWANVHASAVLGLAIAALYLGWRVLSGAAKGGEVRQIVGLGVLSAVITMLNPNGLDALRYGEIIEPALRELPVLEWQSLLDFMNTWQAWIFLLGASFVLVFVVGGLLGRARQGGVDIVNLGLVIGAFALPLLSIRHVGFFPILTLPIFAAELEHFLVRHRTVVDDIWSLPQLTIALGVVLLVGQLVRVSFLDSPIDHHRLPVGAAAFIAAHDLPDRVFSIPAHGGYLGWALPDRKVFIDGRSEVYQGRPAQDFLSMIRGGQNWKMLFDERYKINTVVLWYREPLRQVAFDTFLRLTRELDFKMVYWDDTAIILVRETPETAAFIERFAYRVISPFIDPYALIESERWPAALREYERVLELNPESEVVRGLLRL